VKGQDREPTAFAADRRIHAARATIKAVWWGAAAMATRAITRRPGNAPAKSTPSAEPPPEGLVRTAWLQALEKDVGDVARGLYPPMSDGPLDPVAAFRSVVDVLSDARQVDERRRRRGGAETRANIADAGAYPNYYRQNFHFQSGGWFTVESARRYEAQVETLFAGAAGAMRRRALALLAQAWSERDHRGLAVVDIACGAGAFLGDLRAAFPRARLAGVDLSPAYLAEAARRSGVSALVQANAEHLPFADASLDAVTCIYLFHELPPRIRPVIADEIGRVLKPGGLLAFADSIQPSDDPRLARLLEVFPAYFHEPFYGTYSETDLPALFCEDGLTLAAQDTAFLTKALLFEKKAGGAKTPRVELRSSAIAR
jgi:ubiquinone/menaquinone biosynthesis C-methylase UbiE